MTNLEYHKDELKKYIKDDTDLKNFKYYKNHDLDFIDWLLEEHKEPIKLEKWEFELIGYIYRTSFNKTNFVSYSALNYLRGVGFFKGIIDTDMKLSEILENCEVVD